MVKYEEIDEPVEGISDIRARTRFTYDGELVSKIKTLLDVNHGNKTKVFQVIWDDSDRADIRALPREAASFLLMLIDDIAAKYL